MPNENNEEKKTSLKITDTITLLDGSTLTITKLKAGKYFEAQKAFSTWLDGIQNSVKEVFKTDITDLDKDSVEKKAVSEGDSFTALALKISSNSSSRDEVIAIALGITIEEMNNKFYPEDINLIFSKVIELNNFMENIKNSVAPIAGLGAISQ